MKQRHLVLLGLLALSAYLAIWGDKATHSPAGAPGLAAVPPPAQSPTKLPTKPPAKSPNPPAANGIAALVPRAALMQPRPASGRNLFPAKPAPQALAAEPPIVLPAAPSVPLAPPLPFQFVGKQLDGDRWEVYLETGNQTLIAHSGDLLLGSYRVDEIRPPYLTLTYLPLETKQTLAIGQGEE